MTIVTVSPKYQVVIPRDVRAGMKLSPGEKLQVICHEGRIELIPLIPIKKMRGLFKGINTNVEREKDRL